MQLYQQTNAVEIACLWEFTGDNWNTALAIGSLWRLKMVYGSTQNPSQSYGTSPAILDHPVLFATGHSWTRPAIYPEPNRSPMVERTVRGATSADVIYLSSEISCLPIICHLFCRGAERKTSAIKLCWYNHGNHWQLWIRRSEATNTLSSQVTFLCMTRLTHSATLYALPAIATENTFFVHKKLNLTPKVIARKFDRAT